MVSCLANIMAEKNITSADLANALCLSVGTINRWIDRSLFPTEEMIIKLARAIRCPVSCLIEDGDMMPYTHGQDIYLPDSVHLRQSGFVMLHKYATAITEQLDSH